MPDARDDNQKGSKLQGYASFLGFGFLKLLPPRAALGLMGFIMERLGPRMKRARRMRDTLKIAFPELDSAQIEARVRSIWRNFGETIATIPHLGNFMQGARGAKMHYRGLENLSEMLSKAGIVCGAHVGNWEVSAVTPHDHRAPFVVSYNAEADAITEALIAKNRMATGCELVIKEQIPRKAALALRDKKIMYFTIDQRVEPGDEISFLGLPALATRFPARLAVKYNVPMMVVEAIRLGLAEYEVVYHKLLYPDPEIADPEARSHDLMLRLYEGIENIVKSRPDEWFCLKKRWSGREAQAIRKDRAGAEARAKGLRRANSR